MRFLAQYILRGKIQAIFVAATLAFLSLAVAPFSVLSSAAIALVTLRLGATQGVTVLLNVSFALALLAYVLKVPVPFIVHSVLVLWSTWLIAIALREAQHFSLAIEIAVLIGIMYAFGSYLLINDPVSMWKQALTQIVPANAPVEDLQGTIALMSSYMTQIAIIGGFFTMMLGLFIGRWWQAILFNPGGFRKEFLSLRILPKLTLINIAVTVIIGLGYTLWPGVVNITINLMTVLYAFVGIAVLHTLLANTKMGHFAVPMLYITLFLIPRILLPIALVGFSDTWLDIRKHSFKTH